MARTCGRSAGWIDRELKFPLKFETEDGIISMLRNIQEGSQPADLFVVPSAIRNSIRTGCWSSSSILMFWPSPRAGVGAFGACQDGKVIRDLVRGLIRNLASFGLTAAVVLSAAPVRAEELAPPPVRPASLDNPLAAHQLDEFAATRERPLFSRSRRPFAPATAVHAEPAAPPPSPPNVAFFGTIVDATGASAIIRGAPSEKIVHARVGDEIDGWTIARIEDRQLVLSLDNRSVTFTMFNTGHAVKSVAMGDPPPIVEVNAAGIKQAHRVQKRHP